MQAVDFTTLRKQFPLLDERNYLATHTLGPLPEEAFLDVEAYTQSLCLGRRVFSIWRERYEEMFPLVETLINAPKDSVAITTSSTAAQGAIAAAIQPNTKRNRIITTDLDFASGRYLWSAQVNRGFDIIEIKAVNGLQINAADIVAQIDERVAIVAVSLVSYINSARLDIKPIIKAAHDAGAIVILDAYQAIGVIPIDVLSLNVDVLVGGMNKWLCGSMGLAFAYVKPSLAEQLNPVYPGWFAHLQLHPPLFASTFTPAPGARRFQQGAPSIEPLYTSRAGIRFAIEVGVDKIYQRNLALTNYLIAAADANYIPVNTPRDPASRGGTICLGVNNPTIIVEQLAELGIDVDTSSALGIRVSPHCCNTEAECQQLIESVVKLTHRDKILI
jgi:kynureninase